MKIGRYTARDISVRVELPDGTRVHPQSIETPTFPLAGGRPIGSTIYVDAAAHNGCAAWWRTPRRMPGVTWWVASAHGAGGPAVVDDFGDLVLVEES